MAANRRCASIFYTAGKKSAALSLPGQPGPLLDSGLDHPPGTVRSIRCVEGRFQIEGDVLTITSP